MCLWWWSNHSFPGSGLLNLKECPPPSSSRRRRCLLEGVPLDVLGRGHQELSSAGQGQGTHPNCHCHLTTFSTSIYLRAVALLQPSNVLARFCIQLLRNSSTAKEAKPGVFRHIPTLTGGLWAVAAAVGKQTLKAAKQFEGDAIKLICFNSTKLFLSLKQGLEQSTLLKSMQVAALGFILYYTGLYSVLFKRAFQACSYYGNSGSCSGSQYCKLQPLASAAR